MKRFRINPTDEIKINICHNGQLICKTIEDSGFSSIEQIKTYIKNYIPWNYKGYGRRIEIGIHNLDKQESKYINTFS